MSINNQSENSIDFISAAIVEENSSKKACQLYPVNVKLDGDGIKPSVSLASVCKHDLAIN